MGGLPRRAADTWAGKDIVGGRAEEEKPKLKGLKGSHDRSVGGFTVDSENEKVSRQASVGDAWVTGGGRVDGWAGEGG